MKFLALSLTLLLVLVSCKSDDKVCYETSNMRKFSKNDINYIVKKNDTFVPNIEKVCFIKNTNPMLIELYSKNHKLEEVVFGLKELGVTELEFNPRQK